MRLVHDLLRGSQDANESQPVVEYVRYPAHRDDAPDAVEPFKCKGFAFVTLSSSADVDLLLERWPWEHHNSSQSDGEKPHKAALESGLRCLSKRKWEKFKEEYLLYQQRLLADSASSSAPAPRPRKRIEDDGSQTIKKPQIPDAPSPLTEATYPLDCLVFVKNIQPDTNKTTLKKLFSSAFDEPEGKIDYVDYTKGLDTVRRVLYAC